MTIDKHELIATTQLTIRPKPVSPVHEETAATLAQLTKREICDLSLEKFGVEMKIRNTKDVLIAEFLHNQAELKV